MKINHLLILRKQAKEGRLLSSPMHNNGGDQEPGTSGIRQQPEIIAPETATSKSDTDQDTEVTEGEMTTLHKILWFYKNTSKVLWRLAEIHAVKAVSFVIMLVVVQQVML